MIANILLVVGACWGVTILSLIVFTLFKYPCLPLVERIGLALLASGIVWGGVDRVREAAFGLGDLIMLAGIAITLWRFCVCNPKIGAIK
ncbi:hypothetical protein Q1W73_16400 [Asticcacaulis sp. ZE23SCel15]|uniref:hypothetical protein n=1 Tax=Asticcacaulis sp. ZE23SCel15 TaxID=3059027 RepID=UPI00265E4549|nr:hypothetical protein [Asticcacaulis sp. ZE23SCel15]WKL57224.1 hypothetical protein Q1W73_16400 [Asticcacaulis sp. ZE23SCel15]